MQWNKLYWPAMVLALFIVYGFDGCGKDSSSPDIGEISGLVTQLDGSALSNVKVGYDAEYVFTNGDGYFKMEEVPSGEEVVLEFSKDGYVTNYKKVITVKEENVTTRCALSAYGMEVQVSGSADQEVTFQGAQVDLPANGVVDQSGNLYTGNYTVKATYFDPTSDTYNDVFPGNFTGISTSGEAGFLESFGFIDVVMQAGGQDLDLAAGAKAKIQVPVPTELMQQAPAEIPLFYFDEGQGEWIEEGKATLQNGKYVGEVAHFSSWNCDSWYPADEMCTITGRVVDQDGNPLQLALVSASGVDFVGGNAAYSNSSGSFSFLIKSNSKVVVYAQIASPITGQIIGVSNPIVVDPTCSPGGSNNIGDLVIQIGGGGGGGNTDGVFWDVFTYKKINNYNYDAWAVGEGGVIKKCETCVPMFAENWVDQNSNTTQTLLGVYFIDEDRGWITGNNGTILKTNNGGGTWERVTLNTAGNDLYEVVFYGEDHGWMVGSAGSIWYTQDGGNTWDQSMNGIVQNLYDVDFANENIGWAVGVTGKIFKTTNGGQDWTEQSSGTNMDLYSVRFLNSMVGWASGDNGTILRTRDGGQSWTALSSGTTEDVLSIDFTSPQRGVATCRNGVLLATNDGGDTWLQETVTSGDVWDVGLASHICLIGGEDYLNFLNAPAPLPDPTPGWESINSPVDEALIDVTFLDDQVGIAVGYDGTILRTTDQGLTWTEIPSGTDKNLSSVDFKGNIGYISGQNRTMLRSDDGGLTWRTLTTGGVFDSYFLKVQVYDDKVAWALDQGDGQVLYTVDSGYTWTPGTGIPTATLDTDLRNFEFYDRNLGYVQHFDDATNESTLFRTQDGGLTWESFWVYDSDLVYTNINNLFILDRNTMWVSGFKVILKTEDGGLTWENLTDVSSARAMYFTDPVRGWGIGGDAGTSIIHTTNGGVFWVSQGSQEGYMSTVENYHMINDEVGIAVGGNAWSGQDAVIYRTTTGGF